MSRQLPRCKICEKRFSSTQTLLKHKKVHAGCKEFSCEYCSKVFYNASTHAQHERIHAEKKRFMCNECDKSYVKEYNLNKHAEIHTKFRPNKCKMCGVRYDKKDVLKLHLKEHENGLPCRANRKTLEPSALSSMAKLTRLSSKDNYKSITRTNFRFCRNQINQYVFDSEFTTSESEVSYTSDSSKSVSYTSSSHSDSFNFNNISETINEVFEYDKNEYSKTLYDNICQNQPIVKLTRLSKERLNSILNPMKEKSGKVATFSDDYNELNFNFNEIFDTEIQIELEELFNEIQRAIRTESN